VISSLLLSRDEGIAMNKSHAASAYKLSADQGKASAQFLHRILLQCAEGITIKSSLFSIIVK
jgi:hypothetical protein